MTAPRRLMLILLACLPGATAAAPLAIVDVTVIDGNGGPAEAGRTVLVAATRNGALATGRFEDLGTVEVGKIADLVLLEADPLEDIENIRKLSAVIAGGRPVALEDLPEAPLFYQPSSTRDSSGRGE